MRIKGSGDLATMPGGRTPAEAIRRMRELTAESDPPVRNQHVISRVILKRFAAQDGRDMRQVCFVSLRYPHAPPQQRGPAGCGKVDNFVSIASASLERRWQETENRLHDALQAVDAGTVLASERHTATIKDTIALHFARSLATREISRRMWQQTVLRHRMRWLTDPRWRQALIREFYRRHGLLPGGFQALEELLDDLMASSMEIESSGALFRERIELMHSQVQAWLRRHELEILNPASGEFLLGDVPALTVRDDTRQVGVLGGIALNDAHSVFMPLGPGHIASLGSSPRTAELTADLVEDVNARQVRGAIEHVYMRPGSGLEDFVKMMAGAGQSASA